MLNIWFLAWCENKRRKLLTEGKKKERYQKGSTAVGGHTYTTNTIQLPKYL